MRSPGINEERELRGQPANPGKFQPVTKDVHFRNKWRRIKGATG